MRRSLTAACLAIAMAAAATGTAVATSSEPVRPTEPTPWELADAEGVELVPDRYFVELAAPPSSAGGSDVTRSSERDRLATEAEAEGAEYETIEDYDTLFNGLSVEASQSDIAVIAGLSSVRSVMPVTLVEQPEPSDVAPELAAALGMTGADVAQSELGLDGDGLSVAIIDTGIDYNHPDLGGTGDDDVRITATSRDDRRLGHPRVTHGWDYVGTRFNPADPDAPQVPEPNPDPRDTQGHGSHVAGIVGAAAVAEDGVTGVAPGVTFGAYKVFGPGSTSSDVIVAALEDAYADGMDIVNMSLGATLAWGQDYPTTKASNELVANGVVVVNSAGNDGDLGTYTLSAPANAHDAIAVASADNVEQQTRVFELDDATIPFLPLTGAPTPPTEGTSNPLVDIGRACPTLGDEVPDDLDGRVALTQRGECPFAEKYASAADAGATGVVIWNNVPGLFAGTVAEDGQDDVWGAGISLEDGQVLADRLETDDEVVLTFTEGTVATPNPTGGLLSSFTSYGQDVELGFGPSVTAPGGLIVSTYPLGQGGYASLSGTSMAAPHVAGAAALLLESEPDLDPFAVRDRLQNTAEPVAWSLNPEAGFLDHSFRQGAGMIAVDRAVTTSQVADPAQLALADAPTTTTTLTLTNDTASPVTYTVTHVPSVGTAGSSFTPTFWLGDQGVEVDDTVTVPATGSVEVPVTLTAPDDEVGNHQYGGFLQFRSDDEDVTDLTVPYSGFDGDYVAEMGVFGLWTDPDTYEEVDPVLARAVGDDEFEPVDEGAVFHYRRGDLPVVAPFFGHSAQRLEITAIRFNGQRFRVLDQDYLPRSLAPGARQPIVWDGYVPAGGSGQLRPAGPGAYHLEVRALRVHGDPSNPDHWDTWTSPEFELNAGRRP